MEANTDQIIVVSNEFLLVEAGTEGIHSKIHASAFLSQWHANCFQSELNNITDRYAGRPVDFFVVYSMAELIQELISKYQSVEWIIV